MFDDDIELVPRARQSTRGSTRQHLGAAVTIFASTVSGGLVAVPSAYQGSGLIPSAGLALVACSTTALSLYALGMISERTGLTTYGAVAGRLFGTAFAAVLDGTVGFFLVGVLACSLIVLRDWFSVLLVHTAHAAFYAKLATAGVAGLVILPLGLPRSIGLMAYAGAFSIAAFAALVVVLIGYGAQELAAGRGSEIVWWPHSGGNSTISPIVLGQTFNVAVYQFACQFQMMAIYQDLRARIAGAALAASAVQMSAAARYPPGQPPASLRFGAVVCSAASVMLLLGWLTGIFGVVAFPGVKVNADVLKTLESKPLGGFTHGCLSIGVALSAPLMLHPARTCLLAIGQLFVTCLRGMPVSTTARSSEPAPVSMLLHVSLTTAIVGASLAIALLFDKIGQLISIMGAFVLCPLGIVFPAVALLMLPAAGAPSSTPSLLEGFAVDAGVGSHLQADEKSIMPRRVFRGHGVGNILMCAWMTIVGVATVAISICKLAWPQRAA
jgi:amino acid permease